MSRLLWLRHETKPFEQRVALTPKHVAQLKEAGHHVVVEESPSRIFKDEEYRALGVEMVPANSWITKAPKDATIFGLKELEMEDFPLSHRHIHFAHVYKKQTGSAEFFNRMNAGGGLHYDLEYLVDQKGKRIAAFGVWAGFTGAALGLDLWISQQRGEDYNSLGTIHPFKSSDHLIKVLKNKFSEMTTTPKVLIIGARGRSGRGARQFFEALGIETTNWGSSDTKGKTHIKEILDYDILVNCALMTKKSGPWITPEMLQQDDVRLSVLSDVSCDPTGPCNPLPIYAEATTMDVPATYIPLQKGKSLAITAIDHLPSLLPRESSDDFADQLMPHLMQYMEGNIRGSVWERALTTYYKNFYSYIDPKFEDFSENSFSNELI